MTTGRFDVRINLWSNCYFTDYIEPYVYSRISGIPNGRAPDVQHDFKYLRGGFNAKFVQWLSLLGKVIQVDYYLLELVVENLPSKIMEVENGSLQY